MWPTSWSPDISSFYCSDINLFLIDYVWCKLCNKWFSFSKTTPVAYSFGSKIGSDKPGGWNIRLFLLLLFNLFKFGQIYNSANIFTIQYIITNQNRLTKITNKLYKMNNIYKNKIFYILNIIVKTGT